MADATNPIYYDWKVFFSEEPKRTQGGIYSLYDLIIKEGRGESNDLVYKLASEDSGTDLNHDIICYNNTIYDKKTGKPNKAGGSFSLWAEQGIDIVPVKIDSRAMLHTKEINVINADGVEDQVKIQYFSKDSIVKYSTVQETMQTWYDYSIQAADGSGSNFIGPYVNYDPGWKVTLEGQPSTNTYMGNSVALKDKDHDILGLVDIIVFEEDQSFNIIYNSENTDLIAYKKIYVKLGLLRQILDYYSKAYQGFGFYVKDEVTGECKKLLNAGGIFSKMTNDPDLSAGHIIIPTSYTDIVFEFLKNTYVFIRAPFFGDYVQPDVFQQDLTDESEVKHKNMLISGQSDFHRYSDDLATNSPAKTRFYHVQTSPTVDLLSGSCASKANLQKYLKSSDVTIQDTYDELFTNYKKFGSVLYDNVNNRSVSGGAKKFSQEYLTAPQYFDPESIDYHLAYSNVSSANCDLPTLIPAAGNLYVDGRIFGPTIDEIWKYFKQIVSGTIKKKTIDEFGDDNGFTYNKNHPCDADTVPEERKGVPFYLGLKPDQDGNLTTNSAPTIGDPIESEIQTFSLDNQKYECLHISKWVNPPTDFKIQVYEFLKNASNIVMQNHDDSANIEDPTYSNYDIKKMGPSDNNEFEYDGKEEPLSWSKGKRYGPRDNPYSLRELEAMLANAKYNINALMKFLVKNYTVNGAETTTGSLFQLHKNYNAKIGEPNTRYTGNILTPDSDIEDHSSLRENARSEFGRESADSSNDCTPKDVYLAADGTWRYIHQETKFRVMDTTY